MFSYPPMGPQYVLPEARGLKRLYLRLFGIPDVRAHLTGDYALRELSGLSFTSMLDVGSGNGIITALIGSRYPGCTVLGIDRDEGGVTYASAIARQIGLPNVSFRVSDVEANELTGSFDLVTSFGVLQFIADCPRFIRGVNRVLVPGGHLLLQLPSANGLRSLLSVAELWQYYPDFHEARGPFTDVEATELLTANGFEVVRIREAIKGPSILAKDIFYASLSVSRALNFACCPLLNWITARDGRRRGRGNGLFVLARKTRGV
jgi:SAM-dependent methyltransferase